jgi:hypothetical protein
MTNGSGELPSPGAPIIRNGAHHVNTLFALRSLSCIEHSAVQEDVEERLKCYEATEQC